jgi:RHS repeat-associated protein
LKSLSGRFGFTGQQYLAGLNLYHYKARTYSSTLGHFIETDPVGYESVLLVVLSERLNKAFLLHFHTHRGVHKCLIHT